MLLLCIIVELAIQSNISATSQAVYQMCNEIEWDDMISTVVKIFFVFISGYIIYHIRILFTWSQNLKKKLFL